MPARLLHNPDQVIAAIKNSGGVKTTIAKRLGVSRWTVDNYIARWKAVKLAYDEECESMIDIAETVLLKSIQAGDTTDAKWYLTRKGRHRGYVEKQEHEHAGKDGGPIKIIVEYANVEDTTTSPA